MKRFLTIGLGALILAGCFAGAKNPEAVPEKEKEEEKLLHTCTYEEDDGYSVEYRIYGTADDAPFTRAQRQSHIPTGLDAALTEEELPPGYLEQTRDSLAQGAHMDPSKITVSWDQGALNTLFKCTTLEDLYHIYNYYVGDTAGELFEGEKNAPGLYEDCDGQPITAKKADLSSFDSDMESISAWAAANEDSATKFLYGELTGDAREKYKEETLQCAIILQTWIAAAHSLDDQQYQTLKTAYETYQSIMYPFDDIEESETDETTGETADINDFEGDMKTITDWAEANRGKASALLNGSLDEKALTEYTDSSNAMSDLLSKWDSNADLLNDQQKQELDAARETYLNALLGVS